PHARLAWLTPDRRDRPWSVRTCRSSPECELAMIAISAGSRSNALIPPASISASSPNGLTVERRVTTRSGSPSCRMIRPATSVSTMSPRWMLSSMPLRRCRARIGETVLPRDVARPDERPVRGLAGAAVVGTIRSVSVVCAMLALMPTAQVWHLGLFRDERTLRPVEYYNKLPDSATVDLCLILDPMLATGGSATAAIEVLKKWGAVKPVRIKLVNLIAAP